MKTLRLTILFVLMICKSWAQQSYPVTDTVPVQLNGLIIGYHIKSQEVKAVGNKGNFSRYSISFYVTNTSNAPLIIPNNGRWNQPGNGSSLLARFDILNATGARLTSKAALITAVPYRTMTLVDETNPATNKIIRVKRLVQAGFCIQAGQTISADEIVIVPLNQRPNVQVDYFANSIQPVAYAPPPVVNPGYVPNVPPVNMQGFLKFKSVFNNTYINNQTGALACSAIGNGWWSAQWLLIPIAGTNYVNIKNRWKGNFIDTNGANVIITTNLPSASNMWSMEPTRFPNVFRVKNAQTGGYLIIANNMLMVSGNANDDHGAAWQLEQP